MFASYRARGGAGRRLFADFCATPSVRANNNRRAVSLCLYASAEHDPEKPHLRDPPGRTRIPRARKVKPSKRAYDGLSGGDAHRYGFLSFGSSRLDLKRGGLTRKVIYLQGRELGSLYRRC
jgi:hypothetical protein